MFHLGIHTLWSELKRDTDELFMENFEYVTNHYQYQ